MAGIVAGCIGIGIGVPFGLRAGHSAARPLPRASCGYAATHSLDASTAAYSGTRALACFGAAARHCRAASILVIEQGVDTGTDFVFSIDPGPTSCQVTELSQFWGITVHSTASISTTACRLAAVTGAGVRLGCGEQDLLIPAAVAHRSPPATGPGNTIDVELGAVDPHGNLTWSGTVSCAGPGEIGLVLYASQGRGSSRTAGGSEQELRCPATGKPVSGALHPSAQRAWSASGGVITWTANLTAENQRGHPALASQAGDEDLAAGQDDSIAVHRGGVGGDDEGLDYLADLTLSGLSECHGTGSQSFTVTLTAGTERESGPGALTCPTTGPTGWTNATLRVDWTAVLDSGRLPGDKLAVVEIQWTGKTIRDMAEIPLS